MGNIFRKHEYKDDIRSSDMTIKELKSSIRSLNEIVILLEERNALLEIDLSYEKEKMISKNLEFKLKLAEIKDNNDKNYNEIKHNIIEYLKSSNNIKDLLVTIANKHANINDSWFVPSNEEKENYYKALKEMFDKILSTIEKYE